MSTVTLETRLAAVVGGKTAKAIESALGVETVAGLLDHLPRRYSHRGELTALRELPHGEHVTIVAQVLDVQERKMQQRRGSLLEVRITDGDGFLTLTFFNQAWRRTELVPGARGVFAGKVGSYRNTAQLAHPDYELFDRPDEAGEQGEKLTAAAAKAWSERPIPLYPATAQLNSWTIQRAIGVVLDAVELTEPLPAELVRAEGILPLPRALEDVHRPRTDRDWAEAQDSLRFREALQLQLALLRQRRAMQAEVAIARPPEPAGLLAGFDAALPFALTGDQRLVGETLAEEIAAPTPMHRLLQGEVGSGKTLVALRAMLQVAESGGQSALLAPTEVLAAQHLRSVTESLGPELSARLRPVLITGQMPAAERKRAMLAAASGSASIVIGTHALLSERTTFFDLGLIVVDEQHRFGVEQRETLRRKAERPPHVLVMTATPIPRTVALTAFGDLEVSVIRELPPGRPGITSHAVPLPEHPAWEGRAWARAAEEIAAGRQVYVVCPAIAPGDAEEGAAPVAAPPSRPGPGAQPGQPGQPGPPPRPLATVAETIEELRRTPALAGVRMAELTGAMPAVEKADTMTRFAAGEIDLLVATTVIEVGVNVPRASMMIVRDAERFGISQLHQLRGRVGRGSLPGLCLLLTNAPAGSAARTRVDAVAGTLDGFALAEVDLEQRREGDILGQAQSGALSSLKLLRVTEHGELIERGRQLAQGILDADPELLGLPELRALLGGDAGPAIENLAKS